MFLSIAHSFHYAARGVVRVARHEPTFRLQLTVAVVVCIAALLFRVSLIEALFLIVVIVSVLVLELLNSAVERLVDLLKPRLHDHVGVIKDIMAGAVLIAALGAALVGILIFYPHLMGLFTRDF